MRAFADLYERLDETNRTSEKVAALAVYFRAAPPADAAWAVHFLTGNRPKRLVVGKNLGAWAAEAAGVPPWLFDECYDAVGDLAETVALLLPAHPTGTEEPLGRWIEERLLPLGGLSPQAQRERILALWRELSARQLFLAAKLVTGAFRVGVSQQLVVRALAEVAGVSEAAVAHRLMGAWRPTAEGFAALLAGDTSDADLSRPYPFFLAYPLEGDLDSLETALGPLSDWQAEWKWDGIRAQLIRRRGETFLWSRGEELITERFPELAEAAKLLPEGTVIDGEVLPWREGKPLPFAQLQRRIGRKVLTPKVLAEVPAVLLAFDLLEIDGADLRPAPLAERRSRLAALLDGSTLRDRLPLSPLLEATDWPALRAAQGGARERGAEGLMLKRLASAYGTGRRRGDWWKWKVEPYSVDAVLVYAQRGSGRRASLYTDYTFALWHQGELVPFAKAYSGLTDEEIREVDRFVRQNTLQRFGPVRAVKPELVFELAFEGIARSSRHKCGIAVRFPRMARWRTDKAAADADSLDTLAALLPAAGAAS